MKRLTEKYLKNLLKTTERGDAREESYYKHLDNLIQGYAENENIKNIDVTILPKKTEAGNPDFRIWDGKTHITGYIEAKAPSVTNLDNIENTEQLKRYISTFPNIILTNFYEFRLYRNGSEIARATIGRPFIANKLRKKPPLENIEKFKKLLELFFSFSLPKIDTASLLAVELAKRTGFLRDEIVDIKIKEKEDKSYKQIRGFFEAFKEYLIGGLTEKQFADLYAQTVTYGMFAARTRAKGEFNRRAAFDYIPHTIGVLRDVFRFISFEEPPKSIKIIVDDIAEVLNAADVDKILNEYRRTGKGEDPIIHFYETFLEAYDPKIRGRRGVYYTPQAVVGYITRAIHSILKTHFNLADGLASETVKLLDPAGGTLTFPAEAIRLASDEFIEKYGKGGLKSWIANHILQNFYAFELMMAPYAIGHLKIGFILEELGYKMEAEQRFKLYLTDTLDAKEMKASEIPGLNSLSEESGLARQVKEKQPILAIFGNPPYRGDSANINDWTEKLLKTDIDGAQSYYKVDGKPLGEKKLWLQDDYVKFLRFAQWKIETAGYGVVGMITNHSYLDNPTFRGMRQSLTKTFDEIYILNLHGNSLQKETTPDGGKDENVFDIRQGTAIGIFIKNKKPQKGQVFYADLYGLRKEKYDRLNKLNFTKKNYEIIEPKSPYYFFIKRDTEKIKKYLDWKKITEIFPVNGVGMTTARDKFVIDLEKSKIENRIRLFKNSKYDDEGLHKFYNINKKKGWDIRKSWNMLQEISDSELHSFIYTVTYRPFDNRYIFWHDSIVWRTVKRVMRHMIEENIGLVSVRQVAEGKFTHAFISENIIESRVTLSNKGIAYCFPLYLYPDEKDMHQKEKEPNISEGVFKRLSKSYNAEISPEDILYYIYGIFYSAIYRSTYAEFLKIDFPRVPFTANYPLFKEIGKFGKQLADLHLLKSHALNSPIAKYQGAGDDDRVEKIAYKKDEERIYINADKYFEGVLPEVWHYQIGGYQVLQKYLKDRKNRSIKDAPLYCRIITALSKTMEIEKKIDKIYLKAEKKVIGL